jgi:uncharacterized protein (TIGR02679 family)
MSDQEREALADLLGLDHLPPPTTTVRIEPLDGVLRDALGLGLHDVVSDLIGPVGDRAEQRRRAEHERAALWAWLRQHPVVTAQPALADWVDEVRRGGLLGRSVQVTRERLAGVLRVLGELPASGTPLSVLADRALHDSHGLDDGTGQAGLVLRALAHIYGVTPPTEAVGRRALWERAGVAHDQLSSSVLVAGLRPRGDDVASAVLRACTEAGHAAALTLAQLQGVGWTQGLPGTVWVVENPSVLALALDGPVPCPPLVCTSGWPSGAAVKLLCALAAGGCRLLYHGDFDGEGLRIAAHVAARTGAVPWRMGTDDYRDALRGQSAGPPVGRVTEAPWDPYLANALRAAGVTVSQERVAHGLLDAMRA